MFDLSGTLIKKLRESIGRNHGSEEIVDPLHGGSFLFGLLTTTCVADHDRKIAVVARGPCISFNTPIQVYSGQNQHLHSFAGELERKLRSHEGSLQSHFVELIVARLHQRLKLADQLVIPFLLLRRKIQTARPGFILDFVEFGLGIAFAEDSVADPIERNEILGLARRLYDFDRSRQAAAFSVLFCGLRAALVLERL